MTTYLIDTDVVADIKFRSDHKTIYNSLAKMVSAGKLLTVRQVIKELKPEKDGELRNFVDLYLQGSVNDAQNYTPVVSTRMGKILQAFPKLINLTGGTGKDPADPWLIAVAGVYGYTLVTNESPYSDQKIPAVCKTAKVGCSYMRGPEFLLTTGIVGNVDYSHIHPKDFFSS